MGDVNRSVNVYFNEAELSAALERAQNRAAKLEKQMTDIGDKSSPEFLKLQQQLEITNKKIADTSARLTGNLAPSLKQVQQATQKAWAELNNLPIGTPEWKAKLAEFNNLNAHLIEVKGTVGAVGRVIEGLASQVKTVALGVFVGNTLQAVTQSIAGYFSGIISGAAKVSDEFADIAKTTNLSTEEVKELNKELSQIDTRQSTSELRKIAVEAGKLGKDSVADIKKFVEEANQIKVALGEDLGEDAVTQIGKVSDIFNISMLKIASGINEIGQSSTAAEKFQTEFIFRLAGAAKQAKISAADILGYGAALDINGQQVEASSTALQKFFIDFQRESDKFGNAVGFAKGELQKLIDNKGVNAAFIEFLKRMRETSATTQDFLAKMEALGIDGARGANTFITLANNIDLVKQQQALANKAIEDGTSVTNEYTKRNENLGATIDKIGKEWNKLTASREVQEWLSSGASVTLLFVRALSQLPKWIDENKNVITTLIAVLVIYYRQKIANTIAIVSNTVAEIADSVAKRAKAVVLGIVSAATAAYSLIVAVLTGEMTVAAAVTNVWNKGMQSLQVTLGAMVALVAVVSAAVKLYADNNKFALEYEEKRTDLANQLSDSLENLATQQDKVNETLKQYNTLSEAQRVSFRDQVKQNIEQTKNQLEDLKEQQQDVANSATVSYGDAITGALKLLTFQKTQAELTEENVTKAFERGAREAESFNSDINKLEAAISDYQRILEDTKPAMELYADAMQIMGINAEDLNKKISILELALQRATNPADIDTITKALLAAREALKKFNVTAISESDAEKQAKIFEKLLADIAKLKQEYELSQLNDDEKEIARLKIKYDEIMARAKGHFAQMLELRELYEKELLAIENKQFDNRSDAEYTAQLNAYNAYIEQRKLVAKQEYASTNDADKYHYTIDSLEMFSLNLKKNAALDYAGTSKKANDDVAKFDKEIQEKTADIHIKTNEAISASDDARFAKEKQNQEDLEALAKQKAENAIGIANAAGQALSSITSSLFDLKQTQDDIEFARVTKKYDAEKAAIQKLYDQKLITQEEFNKRSAGIDEEYRRKEAEAKRKAFIADKAQKIISATINTALAVTNALGTNPGPQAIAMAAIAGALGIANIAIIAAQPLPEFGEGGRYDGKKLKGPSHKSRSKGLWVVNPETGQLEARFEGNEWLINANSSNKYDNLLNGINRDDKAAINKWFAENMQPDFSRAFGKINYVVNESGMQYDDATLRKTIQHGHKLQYDSAKYIVTGIVQGVTNSMYANSRKL